MSAPILGKHSRGGSLLLCIGIALITGFLMHMCGGVA